MMQDRAISENVGDHQPQPDLNTRLELELPDLAADMQASLLLAQRAAEPLPQDTGVSSARELRVFIDNLHSNPAVLDLFKLAEMLAGEAWMSFEPRTEGHDRVLPLPKCMVLARNGDWVEKIELDLGLPDLGPMKIRIVETTRHKTGGIECGFPTRSGWRDSSLRIIDGLIDEIHRRAFPTEDEARVARNIQKTICTSIMKARLELLERITAVGRHLQIQPLSPERVAHHWSARFLGKLDDSIPYSQISQDMQRAAEISTRAFCEFHQARDRAILLLHAISEDPSIRRMFSTLAALRTIPKIVDTSHFVLDDQDTIALQLLSSDAVLLIRSNGDLSLEQWSGLRQLRRSVIASGVENAIVDELLKRYKDPEVRMPHRNVDRLRDIHNTIIEDLRQKALEVKELCETAATIRQGYEAVMRATTPSVPNTPATVSPTRFKFVNPNTRDPHENSGE